MNVKRSFKLTAEETKTKENLKTHNSQTHELLNLKKGNDF